MAIKRDKLYWVWAAMKRRCYNPRVIEYKNYGGRGISVSEEWKTASNFLNDMRPLYRKGLTLERIYNNGNYCKENCKWATRKEQGTNRRNTTLFAFNGKRLTLTDWAIVLAKKRSTLSQRYYVYKWSIERVLST